jgi:DNA-binding response OmpR family regulator
VTDNRVVRILVVDDDRSIRETLRVVLQDEHYEVLEAEDGQVALKILQASSEPLVVLLDLRMPVLDGTGVLSAVAADPRLSNRHAILMITANRDSIADRTSQLLKQLQVDVIPKPFDLDGLIDTVDQTARRLGASTGAGMPDSWSDTSPPQATRSSTS